MKTSNQGIVDCVVACALVLVLLAAPYGTALADTGSGFTSDELKKIRFLSRALIKSRALEKGKIDRELADVRTTMHEMEQVLAGAIAEELSDRARVYRVDKVNRKLEAPGELVIDGKVVHDAEAGSPHQQVTTESVSSKAYSEIKQRRFNGLDKRLRDSRRQMEAKVPGRLVFWRKKSLADRKYERAVAVTGQVLDELTQVSAQERPDIDRLQKLRNKLALKKQEVARDVSEPTFTTRTKHRSR